MKKTRGKDEAGILLVVSTLGIEYTFGKVGLAGMVIVAEE